MSIVQAFSLEQTSRLTGVSVAQLRNWDRSGFFCPTFAADNRREAYSRIYSFVDLASLKIINTLRTEAKVSLQHLRDVGKKLKALGEDSWTRITLYVVKRKVVFYNPETDMKEEIVSGQKILDIPLEVVCSSMHAAIEADRKRAPENFGQIEKSRFIAQSQEVIAGTRIPVRAVVSFIEAGYTNDQIILEYPSLTPKDIDAIKEAKLAA
jgi:uncharacterized protein (DUF433 family)